MHFCDPVRMIKQLRDPILRDAGCIDLWMDIGIGAQIIGIDQAFVHWCNGG